MTRKSLSVLAVAAAVVCATASAGAQLFTLTKEQMIEWTSQNPFDRFPDGRPKVPDAMIERALLPSSRKAVPRAETFTCS